MKKVIGITVGALVCSLAATAFAGSDSNHLKNVGVSETQAFLWPDNVSNTWSGNDCTDMGVAIIDTTTDGGRLMYQTVLAAYLAHQVVKAYYTGCIGSSPKVTRIDVTGP